MAILVEVVTPERRLFSGVVDMVTLPGADGQMGVLGGHAPLLSTLALGEIILHIGDGKRYVAVTGGVVEVRPDKVTILADTAEHAEEIDIDRAQVARDRASLSLAENPPAEHRAVMESALRRSNLRLRVAQRQRHRRGPSFEDAPRS